MVFKVNILLCVHMLGLYAFAYVQLVNTNLKGDYDELVQFMLRVQLSVKQITSVSRFQRYLCWHQLHLDDIN